MVPHSATLSISHCLSSKNQPQVWHRGYRSPAGARCQQAPPKHLMTHSTKSRGSQGRVRYHIRFPRGPNNNNQMCITLGKRNIAIHANFHARWHSGSIFRKVFATIGVTVAYRNRASWCQRCEMLCHHNFRLLL